MLGRQGPSLECWITDPSWKNENLIVKKKNGTGVILLRRYLNAIREKAI